MSREQLLAATFVELADTIGDDFEVLDFLQNLATRCTEILGATAVGVILADQRGTLQLVASTTHTSQVLELVAIAISEGPCLDAWRSGAPVVNVGSEEAALRWPRFTREARSLGFASAQVVPMRMRSDVLGALNLLYHEPTVLGPDDVAVAQALAGVATIGLLQERTPRQKEILAEQLQTALALRVVVEQAKGVVAERTGLSVEDSFDRLAVLARRQGRPLSDVATDVLAGLVEVLALDEERN
ncbi:MULTISPECIES: GAF and ANTAR domain-containing protein [unclassified Nocardioides]|uniref:GAF and ANTAR domain-containing protein n=1 Tax=Nocardioides sp. URHA0032 TaxID=1380388 RepID=UPI00056D47A7|nr:GAF and ANTAR domain-containing protein [Nocardioides sp. URHA0032]